MAYAYVSLRVYVRYGNKPFARLRFLQNKSHIFKFSLHFAKFQVLHLVNAVSVWSNSTWYFRRKIKINSRVATYDYKYVPRLSINLLLT